MELSREIIVIYLIMFSPVVAMFVWTILSIKKDAGKIDVFEHLGVCGYVTQKEKCGIIPQVLITVTIDDESYYDTVNSCFLYWTVEEGDWLIFDMVIHKDKITSEVIEVMMSNFRKT